MYSFSEGTNTDQFGIGFYNCSNSYGHVGVDVLFIFGQTILFGGGGTHSVCKNDYMCPIRFLYHFVFIIFIIYLFLFLID